MSDFARLVGGVILVIVGLSVTIPLVLLSQLISSWMMLFTGSAYTPTSAIIFTIAGLIIGVAIIGLGVYYIATSMRKDSDITHKHEHVPPKDDKKPKHTAEGDALFCHKCGLRMKKDAKFCHKCGENL